MIRPSEQHARTPPSELDLGGLSAAGVAALLTCQSVRRRRSVAATLDYFGVLARTTDIGRVVAERHNVTARTLTNNVQAVRRTAEWVKLPYAIRAELADSTADDDPCPWAHRARPRTAATGSTTAPSPSVTLAASAGAWASQRAHGSRCCRAHLRRGRAVDPRSVGRCARPLPAVQRSVSPWTVATWLAIWSSRALSAHSIACSLSLRVVSQPRSTGGSLRWAGDRTLTRQDMVAVLVDAGNIPASASGRLSGSDALFCRAGQNQHRTIGENRVKTSQPDRGQAQSDGDAISRNM